jgi:hypothetical protein
MCFIPCVWLFAVTSAGCKTTMEELVKEKNSLQIGFLFHLSRFCFRVYATKEAQRLCSRGSQFSDSLDFQFPTTENLLAKKLQD